MYPPPSFDRPQLRKEKALERFHIAEQHGVDVSHRQIGVLQCASDSFSDQLANVDIEPSRRVFGLPRGDDGDASWHTISRSP